jgi:aminopeptidase N
MKYIYLFLISAFSFGQQITKVDFIKCDAVVNPKFETKSISGTITYEFKVLKNIDTIRIDAKNMEFTNLKINNKTVNFKNNAKELLLFEGFKKGKNKLSFQYTATPKQTLYFIGENENKQIWTQGQGKYTSYWLPSFDDVNEKVIFIISIKFQQSYTTISNGVLKNINHKKNGYEVGFSNRNFQMQKPMSSYLVMLAIGKFNYKTEQSNSGIPLENYFKPQDEYKYQYSYKDSKKIFDFLEKEIGVKYPWKIYRQIPVDDFLYAGMENTSSTIFSQDFVVDESGFNDRNYINVNAHELAHQWFGDMVTAKSGKHHWLQEGFATYYALLAEKEIFGEDYFYYQLYKNAMQIKNAAVKDTIPVMNEKASSLSFYQKGAWALHTIRENIGPEKFAKVVKCYLKKHKFKNVETNDFLKELAKVSDFDIQKFKKNWLEDYRYQNQEINQLLGKNKFINQLIEIQKARTKPFSEKKDYYLNIMNSAVFYPIKTEILYQIKTVSFENKKQIIDAAFATHDIEVRQAIATTLDIIPNEIKAEYESLLYDKSYDTKELAFVNLWKNFPENRLKYIKILEQSDSNYDKSTRILFLNFALNSDYFSNQDKTSFYSELQDYTSNNYASSIRQNALDTLLQINPLDKIGLINLINATQHFRWQFSKYAREKIRTSLADDKFKNAIAALVSQLNFAEKNFITDELNKI